MDLRPHTLVLPRKKCIWIELSVPQILQAMNTLYLDLHNMFVLLLRKVKVIYFKKIETTTYWKFIIRGLKNKVSLDLGI